ncbi:hypothetical protein [Micromonospora sp. C95]|uniref:hypothetical protein n=1 Tax=Micromonospora sp. C95 TaxID=2824882 RepID=UPI001B3853E2|nr:hypothetical protein [Micromonospora sp. C95]MBQ1026545.1 hypothetical protein [Micromonospora sp. C95]
MAITVAGAQPGGGPAVLTGEGRPQAGAEFRLDHDPIGVADAALGGQPRHRLHERRVTGSDLPFQAFRRFR